MIMNKQLSGAEQEPEQLAKAAAEASASGLQPQQAVGVLRAPQPSRPASSLSAAGSGLPEANQQQRWNASEQAINNRSHRPEPKLSVVIPDNQKSLLTPTIVTTSEVGPFNGPQLCNGLAAAATPIQLFSSLVQDAGLFTGVPSCTPTSAENLALTSNINSVNPFFYGVSGFNSTQSGNTFPPASSEQHNNNNNPASPEAGPPPEVAQNKNNNQQQLNKLSLEQLNAANVMMLSPLFLPISPEHDAWLRQFGLANNQPLAQNQAEAAYNQSVAYQQQQQQHEHIQHQIAAARAAQDLTNQVAAHNNHNNNHNPAGNSFGSFAGASSQNSAGCQQPFYMAPRPQASQQQFASGPTLQVQCDNKQPQMISAPAFANQQAYAPSRAPFLASQPATGCKQATDQMPLVEQQPPAAHNQTSVIQNTSDCNNLNNTRQLHQPVTSGAHNPTPEQPARDYTSSNSNSSSATSSSLDRTSSCQNNNSPDDRSSISRETIHVELSNNSRTAGLGETTILPPTEKLEIKTGVKRNKKMIDLESRIETTVTNSLDTGQFGPELAPKKKSKGGRKKKLMTAEEMVARKNRSKERNRVAAKRCRQKRKQFLDELRDRIDNLNDLNRKLQKENTMLKSELDSLKQRHKSCRI